MRSVAFALCHAAAELEALASAGVLEGEAAREEALTSEHLLNLVFSHLCLEDLCRAAMVRRRWREVTSNPEFWRTINLKGRTVMVSKAGAGQRGVAGHSNDEAQAACVHAAAERSGRAMQRMFRHQRCCRRAARSPREPSGGTPSALPPAAARLCFIARPRQLLRCRCAPCCAGTARCACSTRAAWPLRSSTYRRCCPCSSGCQLPGRGPPLARRMPR